MARDLLCDFEIANIIVEEIGNMDPVVATSAVCTMIEKIAKIMNKDAVEIAATVLMAITQAPEVDEE